MNCKRFDVRFCSTSLQAVQRRLTSDESAAKADDSPVTIADYGKSYCLATSPFKPYCAFSHSTSLLSTPCYNVLCMHRTSYSHANVARIRIFCKKFSREISLHRKSHTHANAGAISKDFECKFVSPVCSLSFDNLLLITATGSQALVAWSLQRDLPGPFSMVAEEASTTISCSPLISYRPIIFQQFSSG